MSDLDHKPGVKEVNLVSHRLKLAEVSDQAATELVDAIGQLFGMDRVAFDPRTSHLFFAYEATHCSVDKIEAVIRQHGARFDDGWWNRIKCSYYRFVDQNMNDNEAHEPHCCNKVRRK